LAERRRNWGAAGLRIVAVIASAYVTAQPLELLVFANDIDKRVHEERVWETIISETLSYTQLKNEINSGNVEVQPADGGPQAVPEQSAAAKPAETADKPPVVNSSDAGPAAAGRPAENITDLQRLISERNQRKEQEQKARSALNEATATLKGDQGRLEDLRKKEARAEQEARNRKNELDRVKSAPESPAALADAEEAYQKAVKQVAAINASITRTEAAISSDEHRKNVLAPTVDNLHQDLQDAEKAVSDRRQELNHKLEALQQWVTRLANSLPSEREFEQGNYRFKQLPYSFNEQRRVLDDIRYARPIQRHNLLSIQDKNVLSHDLQIGDPAEADMNTQSEREASAVTARWLYWSFFVAALFVPSMGLIFKMTIHRQLKQYYSLIWQASVGHPEAMQAIQEPRLPPNPGRR
jgi:DNA repair exonuclease SbcCD ATPase subunit